MRRSRAKKTPIGVSLFPFLAVLICTMGALIVLLVLVVKRASVYATEQKHEVASQWADEEEQLRSEQETEEFRHSTLLELRPNLTEQLADRRKELGHVESHIRELQAELESLTKQYEDLQRVDPLRDRDLGADNKRLATLKQQIAEQQQRLDKARRRAASQPRSFAVVPYKGPNGTQRRPIFVECREDRVILQPEGIELTPHDFRDPLVPGNPLDAALLAVRDYLLERGGVDAHGEPYPLLLCRSSGTMAYNKARAAMRSWDDEFGYELIDDEMNLAYPKPDPNLAKILQQAVDQARLRQKMLERSQPARFRQGGGEGGRGDDRISLRASATHGGFIVEGTGGAAGGYFREETGAATGSGLAANDQTQQGQFGQPQEQQPGQANGNPNSNSSGQRNPNSNPSGQRNPNPNPGGQPGGTSQMIGSAFPPSIAQQRGADWALPSKSAGATPFRRQLHVMCFPDELVIVPQRGTSQRTQVIPMPGATADAVQQFVAAIWSHMETWGIAGRNAYWKPELLIQVAPGGQRRFQELMSLMRNSGFDFTTHQQ